MRFSLDAPSTFLGLFSFTAIATYFSVAAEISVLKPLAAFLQIVILVHSVGTVFTSRDVNPFRFLVFILPLSFYPLVSAYTEGLSRGDVKSITDAIFLFSAHFQLPIIAMAFLLKVNRSSQTVEECLRTVVIVSGVFLVLLAATGRLTFETKFVGSAYSFANNLLVPLIVLGLMKSGQAGRMLQVAGLTALFILAVLVASRSYLVVGVMFVVASALSGPFFLKVLKFLFVIAIVPLLAPLTVGDSPENFEQTAIVQKLRLDSLRDIILQAWETSDVMLLFYWEGNSRAGIIEDAFRDFDATSLFFGRGFFATYDSFVVRNTIEIGWAQSLFWLGLVFVVPALVLALFSLIENSRYATTHGSRLMVALNTVIFVRLIDSMIFGMPTYEVYSLLFWMAVMFACLRPSAKMAVIRSSSNAA